MVAAKTDIRNLSYEELVSYIESIGEKKFRADQIFDWLYQKNVDSFDGMKNLSKALKEKLEADFTFTSLKVVKELKSEDGTYKALFELSDNEMIETVLIPTKTRATVCVSTQAGCKFGCRFCASGIGGWRRNLEVFEILAQILHMKKHQDVTHIVFMGVGEPMDNYDNLISAIKVINAAKGIGIGARRITISTCGVIPKIKQLATEGMQLELAISLHGFNNESRNVLMPVNKKYPFADLVGAVKEYIQATKRQVTFEYILIKDVTCSDEAVKELKKHLKGMICKMNLIPYNPVSEFDHAPPSRKECFKFRDALIDMGVHATVRTPRGRDVSAACGQLRHASKK